MPLIQKNSSTMGPSSVSSCSSSALVKGLVKWSTCSSLLGGPAGGEGCLVRATEGEEREEEKFDSVIDATKVSLKYGTSRIVTYFGMVFRMYLRKFCKRDFLNFYYGNIQLSVKLASIILLDKEVHIGTDSDW